MTTTQDTQRISHFVDADGIQLHALDWGGNGPPLLMVHGTGRTGRSWNAIARRLRDDYRVIALDLRGHGDSGASPLGNDTLGRMRDIERVVDALHLPPHFVMGHSLGAMPAGIYAVHHPERVRGVFLIEPVLDAHVWWTQGKDVSKEQWKANDRRTAANNGWPNLDDLKGRIQRNNMTKNWHPEALDDVLNEETRFFPDGRVEFKLEIVYNLDELWDDRESLLRENERLTMPTIVLARHGNTQIETQMQPFVDSLAQGKLEVVPNLGHAMYMEDPALMADIFRRFAANA